jgi:hypothetical protein
VSLGLGLRQALKLLQQPHKEAPYASLYLHGLARLIRDERI